jgi:flagellin
MSLSILTNISAMNTQQNLLNSSNAVAKSMQRLSSGLRINTAADDAAGYAISEGLTSQTSGLDQAAQNTSDATSMVQTASSSLTDVTNMLQRVRELAVQYDNGTNSSSGKAAIQSEVDQLTGEINRETTSSNFNGTNLLDGSAGAAALTASQTTSGFTVGTAGSISFQVGANQGNQLTAKFSAVVGNVSYAAGIDGGTLSTGNGFVWANSTNVASHVFDLSSNTLTQLDSAISAISSQAGTLGAIQNRLQYTADSISSTNTNLAAANSSIKDVNMASEMTHMTQQQILEQAGTAMLAQANSQPQMILKLLQ